MKYLITGHQTVCGVKLLDFVSTSPSMFNRPAELASVNLFFKLLGITERFCDFFDTFSSLIKSLDLSL
jgi:hypothetical protein